MPATHVRSMAGKFCTLPTHIFTIPGPLLHELPRFFGHIVRCRDIIPGHHKCQPLMSEAWPENSAHCQHIFSPFRDHYFMNCRDFSDTSSGAETSFRVTINASHSCPKHGRKILHIANTYFHHSGTITS